MHGSVYLAGPMAGLTYEDSNAWRIQVARELWGENITTYSPLRAKEFLAGKVIDKNQEQLNYPLATPDGITARDRFDIRRSDIVLMNLLGAEERISIGTCIEIGWADAWRKPLIMVCDKDGQFDEHPMVARMNAAKVHTLDEAITLCVAMLKPDDPVITPIITNPPRRDDGKTGPKMVRT